MTDPLLERPQPDFVESYRVMKGQQKPQRVHLVELPIDYKVLQAKTESLLGYRWVSSAARRICATSSS